MSEMEKDIIDETEESAETQETEVTEDIQENEEIIEEKEPEKDYEAILAEEKDKYLRLFAEYDNYRKRTAKEKTEIYGDAASKTVAEILPAIDNFERALEAETSDEAYKNGIQMIFNQIQEILKKIGVTEIDALNQPFNPNIHVAIKQMDDENFGENTVCQVFQKGYKLGDRIVRPAMVAVAN
ncbi:MAG: nucleotide exchange factor GrpE [Oscillospiraceae bacterium]